MKKILLKTIVIVGPTASGKSDLAISLARKYNGEIISADSRQVYRGMDIGTGKVTKAEQRLARHWLLDVANPKRNYNVTHFVRDAKKALKDIDKRSKTAIICGGTGFWVQALLEDNPFPSVKPDPLLRRKLNKLSAGQLFTKLKKQDPRRAKTIDAKNKVRLIRALEIVEVLGKVPALPKNHEARSTKHDYIILGLNVDKEVLWKNIKLRLEKRLRKGMVAEVKRLREEGVSWKKLESFGLEYKYIALYLQKKLSRKEKLERLEFEIRHFAKRQLVWLNRMEKQGWKICWVSSAREAEYILSKFWKVLLEKMPPV